MPPEEVVLFKNIALSDVDTGGQTSTIGEPSVANNGREIFMTGNWYATKSLDDGSTWDFVSPRNTLPPASGGVLLRSDDAVRPEPGHYYLDPSVQHI